MASYKEKEERRAAPQEEQQEPEAPVEVKKEEFETLEPFSSRYPKGVRPSAKELPFSETKEVTVAVDEMPLPDFIHYIFSDILKVNYVVDKKVKRLKDTVTLDLNQRISEYGLFELVTDILETHKISIFVKDGVYYLVKDPKTKDVALGVGRSVSDIPVTTGNVRQLVPIRYGDVRNLMGFLPKLPNTKIDAASPENMIVVTGPRDQVEQIIEMIGVLDRPALRGRYVGKLELKFWNPTEMVEKLTEILTQEGIPIAKRAGGRGVFINAIENWGVILVFAAEREWLNRVRYWARILDVPIKKDQKQYFLYFPQHSKASELGESLQKILGLGAADISGEAGLQPITEIRGGAAGDTGTREATAEPETGKVVSAIAGDVVVAVDENRNALIIYATYEKYTALELLLKQLDVIPVQVLLEAMVAEVTLTDSLQYGLEWFIDTELGDLGVIASTSLGLGAGGLDVSLIESTGDFQALINALAEEELLKILSSPRVTVRDGKSASIVVGTEVPITTSAATTPDVTVGGTSGIIQSVEYRSTGVTLRVTPTVHAERIVTLEIYQEVSEAQQNPTSDIDSPIIRNSTLTTEVVAADNQTVLLGGLIQENESETVNKVPLLGDVPLLGHLFKTTSIGTTRTELVIMITPHIIRNTDQIDEMREAIFESFEHLQMEE